jgi:hypothetical protein
VVMLDYNEVKLENIQEKLVYKLDLLVNKLMMMVYNLEMLVNKMDLSDYN